MWEYKIERIWLDDEEPSQAETYLKELGKEKWELIQVIPDKDKEDYGYWITAYFKRLVE